MTKLWKGSYFVQKDIDQIKDILSQQHIELEPYKEKTDQLIQQNGKMIRAEITVLFGRNSLKKQANQTVGIKKLHKAAAAIELLHLATLVHDDVLDNANKRRGLTTLQHFFGNKNTVYLGDQLFTKYFQMVTDVAPSKAFIAYHAAMMEKILAGELIQDTLKFQTEVTLPQYYEAIKGKTATLFSLAAVTGTWVENSDEYFEEKNPNFQAAFNFGYHLGMAFQMIDDLQDINPNSKTDKPKFEDIQNGIYTLPIILALENDHLFKKMISTQNIKSETIYKYFISHPELLQRSQAIAKNFLDQAQADLRKLADNSEITELNKLIDKIQSLLNLTNI